jgi:AAA domain/Bifunctional DNA primase/polymerase, N-terminal/Primase C terminal 1 (PriCT-1)
MSATPVQAAMALAEEFGIPVFACRQDKKPYTTHGFKDASTNIERISEQFDARPDALIGVPTGTSSKLLVIDVDPDGLGWYAENSARLACGRVHKTRRGYHLLYRMPSSEIRNSTGKIARGVDVRAIGGYFIWWPAHGCEAIGGLEELTDPPQWIIEKLAQGAVSNEVQKPNGSGIPKGQRNASLASLAGKMRRAGASQGEIEIGLEALNGRCEPPLPKNEIHAIAASIATRYSPGKDGADAPEHAGDGKPSRVPLDWRALESQTPPERQWAIDHWLGMGHVTLLAGAGGTGKTLIAQAMGSCIALRREYLDWMPAQRRVLMWACEDDVEEVWRRQAAIARLLDVKLADFADRFTVLSYDGQLVELAGLFDQRLVPMPMLIELREQIGDYKADVVLLDNVARLYAGNENDRHQVTSFIAMLTAAAAPTKAAVMLLGHPAKAQGSEYSGSTAWEGAVRARLYLGRTLPDADKDEAQDSDDDGVRYLCRRKANYSARDWRRLQFRDGVIIPDPPVSPGIKIGAEFARDVVTRAVRKLADIGETGVASSGSPKYLPRLAREYKLLERLSEKEFAVAMRAMRTDGVLVMAVVGKYANRNPREALVLADGK